MEASKEKVYKGNNPDSLEAWLYTDISPTQNSRILLDDKFGSFEWDQNKSNKNVLGISDIGSGEGKGFSFYFARYGYTDKYRYEDESLSINEDKNKNYSGSLALVNFEKLEKYVEINNLKNIPSLRSSNDISKNVLLLLNEYKNNSRITIVSATYTLNEDHIREYSENASDIFIKEMRKSQQGSAHIQEKICDFYIQIKNDIMNKLRICLIEGTKEFEELLKYHN